MKKWTTLAIVAVAAVALSAAPVMAGHRHAVRHHYRHHGAGHVVRYVPRHQVYYSPVIRHHGSHYYHVPHHEYHYRPVHRDYHRGHGYSGGVGVHTGGFGLHIRF